MYSAKKNQHKSKQEYKGLFSKKFSKRNFFTLKKVQNELF